MASSRYRACPITGKLRSSVCSRCSRSRAATAATADSPAAAARATRFMQLILFGEDLPSIGSSALLVPRLARRARFSDRPACDQPYARPRRASGGCLLRVLGGPVGCRPPARRPAVAGHLPVRRHHPPLPAPPLQLDVAQRARRRGAT